MENLDDRREVWHLLHALRPSRRYRFIRWCCKGCRVGSYVPKLWHTQRDLDRLKEAERTGGAADVQISNECYGYLWSMATQYGLDLAAVTITLEALTRGRLTFEELESCSEWELTPCGLILS